MPFSLPSRTRMFHFAVWLTLTVWLAAVPDLRPSAAAPQAVQHFSAACCMLAAGTAIPTLSSLRADTSDTPPKQALCGHTWPSFGLKTALSAPSCFLSPSAATAVGKAFWHAAALFPLPPPTRV